MKSKDLANILLAYPEFDVEFGLFEADGTEYGAGLRIFEVMVDDIGYSSKIIRLGSSKEID